MTPAVEALRAAGVAFEILTYDHDPAADAYGEEAADLLGLDPAAVFKTLVADTGEGLVVAVVPVTGRLDLKALARAVGSKRVTMADPVDAERSTGYVVGGISPIGQRRALPTVIDLTVTDLAQVHVSGGRRGLEIRIAPTDLVSLLHAELAPIATT